MGGWQHYAEMLGFTVAMDTTFGNDGMRWVMLRPPGGAPAITLVTWFDTMSPGSQPPVHDLSAADHPAPSAVGAAAHLARDARRCTGDSSRLVRSHFVKAKRP